MMEEAGAARAAATLADSDDVFDDVFAEEAPSAAAATGKPAGEPVAFHSEAAPAPPAPRAAAPTEPAGAEPISAYYASGSKPDASADSARAKAGADTLLVDEDGRSSLIEEDQDTAHAAGRSTLEDAIPLDRIKNGAQNALKFWQWGVAKVQENETVQRAASKVGEAYEQVKPGLEKVREATTPVVDSIRDGANSAYERSKPKIEELRERSKPTFEELSAKAGESWTITKQKVGELTEACRPGIDRAAEKTRNAFNSVAGTGEHQAASARKESAGPILGPAFDEPAAADKSDPFTDI